MVGRGAGGRASLSVREAVMRGKRKKQETVNKFAKFNNRASQDS